MRKDAELQTVGCAVSGQYDQFSAAISPAMVAIRGRKSMKIIIDGTSEEIAALVLSVQGRQRLSLIHILS